MSQRLYPTSPDSKKREFLESVATVVANLVEENYRYDPCGKSWFEFQVKDKDDVDFNNPQFKNALLKLAKNLDYSGKGQSKSEGIIKAFNVEDKPIIVEPGAHQSAAMSYDFKRSATNSENIKPTLLQSSYLKSLKALEEQIDFSEFFDKDRAGVANEYVAKWLRVAIDALSPEEQQWFSPGFSMECENEILLEFWGKRRSLAVSLKFWEEDDIALKSYGTNIFSEMEEVSVANAADFRKLWEWLHEL